MRLLLSGVAFVWTFGLSSAVLATEPPKGTTSEDLMRNGRMNACVSLLRKTDTSLRNNWRMHCDARQVDQELASDGPDQPLANLNATVFAPAVSVIGAGETCADPVPPVAAGAACGLGSKTLYEGLTGAAIRVRLPNKQCGAFIPLLLTNKTDFACNAVQSRIACADVSYDAQSDRTTIKLSARRGKPSENVVVTFGATELAAAGGRLDALIHHPQFAMVPALPVGKPLADKILAATAQKQQACLKEGVHSSAECAKIGRFQADAYMQEALRRYRNPKVDSPPAAITKDGQAIVAFLKANGIDKIQEQWILFQSIAKNEVGLRVDHGNVLGTYDPIYGLSDAVADDSGLTFGAHQIDLGANDDSEVKLFWDVVDAFAVGHHDEALDAARGAHDCVDLPLRLMTVGALALTYRGSPKMTEAARSTEGMAEYNRRMLQWLVEETRITAAKQGLFRNSMITRVLFSDLKNQAGSGARVEKLAGAIVSHGIDLGSCQGVRQAEDRLLATMIWKDPDHPSDDNRTTYADRYDNIRDIVRGQVANGGIGNCS